MAFFFKFFSHIWIVHPEHVEEMQTGEKKKLTLCCGQKKFSACLAHKGAAKICTQAQKVTIFQKFTIFVGFSPAPLASPKSSPSAAHWTSQAGMGAAGSGCQGWRLRKTPQIPPAPAPPRRNLLGLSRWPPRSRTSSVPSRGGGVQPPPTPLPSGAELLEAPKVPKNILGLK